MRIKLLIVVFGLAAAATIVLTGANRAGVETAAATPTPTPTAAVEVANYKAWKKITDTPFRMNSRVAMMCQAPTRAMIDEEKKNPHIDKFVNVYVNETGAQAMVTRDSPKFPVGSVIVKEKLPSSDSTSPELLTVMIKREKGYDPEIGDWEFLTVDGEGKNVTSRGKLQNCRECHISYKESDFVTRVYVKFK